MRDIDLSYRTGVFTALNGLISYNAQVIPVYSGFAEPDDSIYIMLLDVSDSPGHDKHKFSTEATITIEIVDRTGVAVSYKAIDSIYNSIMEILNPAPYTAGFSIGAPFQVLNPKVISTNHITENFVEIINRKVFRLQTDIIQNS